MRENNKCKIDIERVRARVIMRERVEVVRERDRRRIG